MVVRTSLSLAFSVSILLLCAETVMPVAAAVTCNVKSARMFWLATSSTFSCRCLTKPAFSPSSRYVPGNRLLSS